MGTHKSHMASILMGTLTTTLLLFLLPHVHTRGFDTLNNYSNQRLNTLNNNNLNQTRYRHHRQTYIAPGYQNYGNTPNYSPFMDLKGKYCETRRGKKCCDNRIDECNVPVMGTLCYCDDFCDRIDENQQRNPPDCCPDYNSFCRGITNTPQTPRPVPPPGLCLNEVGKRVCEDGSCCAIGINCKYNCNICVCDYKCIVNPGSCTDQERKENKTMYFCENDPCMIGVRALATMKSNPLRYSWTASNYSKFWGHKSAEGHIYRTGAARLIELNALVFDYNEDEIPVRFDATNPPISHLLWAGKVGGIRDQGWCGSSWALATLAVAEDRLAISAAVKGFNIKAQLSPQQLISCDHRGQRNRGCLKGFMDVVWKYLQVTGVVTESCHPYTSSKEDNVIAECPFPRKFAEGKRKNDKMEYVKCPDGKDSRIYQFEPAYRIAPKESDIMYEIMTEGPVQALMKVRDDFFMYQSGVYSHDSSLVDLDDNSYHVVRIVGWGPAGYESPKYWKVANTWGTDWGEDGFFRIKRGTNESEIENLVLATRPQIHKIEKMINQEQLGYRYQ